jgi:hypothetical protein
MSSVDQDHAGVASGVNNAVARTAGLMAIAVLGIVMLQVFNRALDHRLANAPLPAEAVTSLKRQRSKLAAAELPAEYPKTWRDLGRQAVNDSFVTGFRTIMLIGAGLALAGAATALLVIAPRSPPANQKTG